MIFEFLRVLPNEVIWILFALINFTGITLFYKLYGKGGLFIWIGFGTVIANIQVVKTIEMFGLTATLGNIMYGTLFLATDALGEKYGHKAAKQAVWSGFLTLLFMVIIMQFALIFKAAEIDFAQESLEVIFGILPRIAAGSLIAYLVSQFFDVYFFQKIKQKFPGDDELWLRNIGSTVVSQLLDSVIFCTIAFLGEYEFGIWLDILYTTYIIKVAVALLDTPFVYLIKKIKPLNNIE
jgi:queuosine precursor transporter